MKNTISIENFIGLYNWIVTAREMITTEDDTNKSWVQRFKDTDISTWEYQYVKDITNNPDIDYPLKYTIYDLDINDHNHTKDNYIYYGDPKKDTIIHIYLDDKTEWTPDNKPINIKFRNDIPFSEITPINIIIIPKNAFTLNISSGDNIIETLYKLKEYYTEFFTDMVFIDVQEKIFAVDILAETLTNIFLHGNIIDYDIDKIYEYKMKELEKEEVTTEFYKYKSSFKSFLNYIKTSKYFLNNIEDTNEQRAIRCFQSHIELREIENYIKSEYLNTITDFVTFNNSIIDITQNNYYTNHDVNKIKYLYLDYLDQYKYKYFNAIRKVSELVESKKKKDEVESIKVDRNTRNEDNIIKEDGDKDANISVPV